MLSVTPQTWWSPLPLCPVIERDRGSLRTTGGCLVWWWSVKGTTWCVLIGLSYFMVVTALSVNRGGWMTKVRGVILFKSFPRTAQPSIFFTAQEGHTWRDERACSSLMAKEQSHPPPTPQVWQVGLLDKSWGLCYLGVNHCSTLDPHVAEHLIWWLSQRHVGQVLFHILNQFLFGSCSTYWTWGKSFS